jgi:hypothetical protein
MSAAAMAPNAGAAETLPLPVWARKFFVAVVFPARLVLVFVPDP